MISSDITTSFCTAVSACIVSLSSFVSDSFDLGGGMIVPGSSLMMRLINSPDSITSAAFGGP